MAASKKKDDRSKPDQGPEKRKWIDPWAVFATALISLAASAAFNAGLSLLKGQPWHFLWVLLPLGGLLVWLFQSKWQGAGEAPLGAWRLLLVGLYVVLFSAAAASGFLDWKNPSLVATGGRPPNFLALNWLGDWRYSVAPLKLDHHAFAVVTLDPPPAGSSLEGPRREIAQLMNWALDAEATGIALDFHFKDNSQMDWLICQEIDRFRQAGKPVLAGQDFEQLEGHALPLPIAENLLPCLPTEQRGHTIGYREWDGTVRSIPLFFQANRRFPAFSLVIARSISPQLPPQARVQFLPPSENVPVFEYQSLVEKPDLRAGLSRRFVLVGEKSERDTFKTPFGPRPGVLLHAYAAHSLLVDHSIQRISWLPQFLFIFGFCCLIAWEDAGRASTGKLTVLTLVASASAVVLSALSMWLWLAWLDVIYPLLAGWIFLGLSLTFRRVHPPGTRRIWRKAAKPQRTERRRFRARDFC